MDLGDPIKTTVEEIRKVINVDNVIGDIIEIDDKVLIPITKMGMGFGTGGGKGQGYMGASGKGEAQGKGEGQGEGKGEGEGAGAGGAAGVEPIAMIVVFKNVSGPQGVKVLTLTSNAFAQALGELGSAAMAMLEEHGMKMKGEWMKKHKKGKDKEEEEEAEETPLTP